MTLSSTDRGIADELAVVVLAACATWESIVEESHSKGLTAKAATARAEGGDTVTLARKVASQMLLEHGVARPEIDSRVNRHLSSVAEPLKQEGKLRAVDARRAHRESPDVLSAPLPGAPRVSRKAASGDRMLYKAAGSGGGLVADVVKAAVVEAVEKASSDILKAASNAVQRVSERSAERYGEQLAEYAELSQRIAAVERVAAAPGPVRRDNPRSSPGAKRRAEIARLRKVAEELQDPYTRRGYLAKVAALEEEEQAVESARAIVEREGRR